MDIKQIERVVEGIRVCAEGSDATCTDCPFTGDGLQALVCKSLLEQTADALATLMREYAELVEMYTKLGLHAQDLHKERQPVKATRDDLPPNVRHLGRCGSCRSIVAREWKACPRCAKKIDWSDWDGLGGVRTDS